MSSRRWLAIALAGLAAALLLGRGMAAAWADWRWFVELGAKSAWRLQITETLLVHALIAGLGATFAAANFYAVRQSVVSLVLPRRLGNLEIGEEVPARYLTLAVIGLAVVTGGILAFAAPHWTQFALARHAVPFGETAPYAGEDFGFFVYWLPFEAAMYEWAVVATFAVATLVVVLYALTPALRWERGRLHVSGWVRRHLTSLCAVVLVLLAWGVRLDAYVLPIEGSGIDGAFTAVDHRVGIPANLMLALATLGASIVVFWSGWTGQLRVAFGAVSVVLSLALGVRVVLPLVAERLVEPSAPAARDAPYLETRNSYTRRAYGLEAVESGDRTVVPSSAATLGDAIPSWDPAALRRLMDRLRRSGRMIGAVGWRVEGSALRAIGVADPERTDEPMAPWTVLEADGAPDAEAGGLPEVREHLVAPVLVYDSARGPLIVNDPSGHVLSPTFAGLLERIAHAWALQMPRLVSAPVPGSAPVIVLRRDVRTRVRALVPFFDQGSVVTPLVDGDTLWWALDTYAVSGSFPLSRRIATTAGDVRYLRQAATALVNATTGRTVLVLAPTVDPITKTWVALAPDLFTHRESLPPAMAAALPPPFDGARVQAIAFAVAGSRTLPSAAGRRIPAMDGGDTTVTAGGPTLWRSRENVLQWSVPVLDAADHVRGMLVNSGGRVPTLRWYPVTDSLRWGDALEQLAGRRGADDLKTTYGRVRSVPLGDGTVALIQPRFAWPVAGPPSLEAVAVWTAGSVRTGRSLAALGAGGGRAPTLLDAQARARLSPLYERMREGLRRGDWSAFGAAFDDLARSLGRDPRTP